MCAKRVVFGVLVSFLCFALPTCLGVRMYYVCPPDFLRLGSSCYFFSTAKATWQEAFFACKDRDSNLTTPLRWEDRNIREYLSKPDIESHERWIGGMYDWSEQVWKWAGEMQKLNYQSFSRLKKFSPDELKWHCVAMVPELLYRWAPRNCVGSKHYICQTKLQKVQEKGRNKLREKWNPNGNGRNPNEIPAPNLSAEQKYSAYNTSNTDSNTIDNQLHPDNLQALPANRPRPLKKTKPFPGFKRYKLDPQAAYIANVKALEAHRGKFTEAQIQRHLQRLERMRKKDEQEKMRRERDRDRENSKREQGKSRPAGRRRQRGPRKIQKALENVTQRTFLVDNHISELHPKEIVEVHSFSKD